MREKAESTKQSWKPVSITFTNNPEENPGSDGSANKMYIIIIVGHMSMVASFL